MERKVLKHQQSAAETDEIAALMKQLDL